MVWVALFGLCFAAGAGAQTTPGTKPPKIPQLEKNLSRSIDEKELRTAAQKKLDSHIVLALRKSRGEAPFDQPTPLDPDLTFEPDGRVLVDITAKVTPDLLTQIEKVGGAVTSSFADVHAIRATVPLGQMEKLAARADVTFIAPAAKAIPNNTSGSAAGSSGQGAGNRPSQK